MDESSPEVNHNEKPVTPLDAASRETEDKLAEIRGFGTGEAKLGIPPTQQAALDAFARESWQILVLRYLVFIGMYGLLCAEIHAVLSVLDKQGRGIYRLADWLIGLLITVIFFQTIWVLQVIATHLFPKGGRKMGTRPGLPPSAGEK